MIYIQHYYNIICNQNSRAIIRITILREVFLKNANISSHTLIKELQARINIEKIYKHIYASLVR